MTAYSLSNVQREILFVLKKGPATAEEIDAKILRGIKTVRARLSRLKESGCIEPTGEMKPSLINPRYNSQVWRLKGGPL